MDETGLEVRGGMLLQPGIWECWRCEGGMRGVVSDHLPKWTSSNSLTNVWPCAVLNRTLGDLSMIRSSRRAARASITHEESSATAMYESTTRRIEIKQLDASHSSPDHLCLPASINAAHGHETFIERLQRERKGTEYLILIGTKPNSHQASVFKRECSRKCPFWQ